MKTSLLLTILLFISNHSENIFRTETTFPFSVNLETIEGQIINSSAFINDRQILIIDFWTTHCAPCIETFNSIRDNNSNWNEKTDAKIIAIATQARDEKTVKFIKEKNWPFEVYFDPDYNLFKALAKHHQKGPITFVFPTMFLFDNENKMVDKLEGAKHKLKDGVELPAEDETLKADMLEIDLKFYYDFIGGLKAKK